MKTFHLILTALFGLFQVTAYSQGACGFGPGKGCPNTEYDYAYMNSGPDASLIEYDNFVSTFHSTIVRDYQGNFIVWGEKTANNGTGNLLTPTVINTTNFPALSTHEIYKAAGGSRLISTAQFILLTSDGLYAWGNVGAVIENVIKPTTTFGKITTTAISN